MGAQNKTDRPKPVIYTQALCGYCAAARQLLKAKGVAFTEINVTFNARRRAEMIERSGQRTVPQIFIGERHIGGYDDMAELDHRGELDALLGVH